MNIQFEIFKSSVVPAPICTYRKNASSQWRDLFEAMGVGDWFVLPTEDHKKACNAAGKYLRGRYSLYKHPETANFHIFLKTK